MSEDDPIKNELNEILSKLRSGDSDLERLKLRLYATRQAIQIRAIECAEKRLTHEGEVLSHLREGSGSARQDRVLPEASWPVYVQKNLPKVWNEVLEEEGLRPSRKKKILLKPLSDKRIKNAR